MHNTVCGSPLYMAPEIMKIFINGNNSINNNSINNNFTNDNNINDNNFNIKHSYDSKCDLWSLGLIIYECVYKDHPFKDSLNILDLNKNIFCNKIIFHDMNKNNVKIDYLLIDLLSKMLVIDTKKRITWEDYFNHEWFKSNININLNITSPIQIPTLKNKLYDHNVHSLPVLSDLDINERINRPKNDINTIKDYFINHLYNKEISDDVMETIEIYTDHSEPKKNKKEKNNDIDYDYDYIIINESEMPTFDDEPQFINDNNSSNNLSNNIYNALSSSYEYIKKPFKYFSY